MIKHTAYKAIKVALAGIDGRYPYTLTSTGHKSIVQLDSLPPEMKRVPLGDMYVGGAIEWRLPSGSYI